MAAGGVIESWRKASREQRGTAIYRIADRLAPVMRRRFLAALAALQGRIDLDALAAAIQARDLPMAERLLGLDTLPHDLAQTADVIRQVFQAAGEVAAAQTSDLLRAAISFSVTNPRAVQWARTASSRLITEVTETTREAVRTIIGAAIEEGHAPIEAARLIRGEIGLTPGQAGAVARRLTDLLGRGIPTDEAVRRAGRYAQQLLNYRAKVIARTETIAAANQGQQELWRQAVDAGLLDRDTKREWLVTEDDRLCQICEPMDGQVVGLEEPFETGDGERVLVPPAHPQCRCAIALNFARAREAA